MSSRDFGEREIKADILNRLFRRGCWGRKYLPIDSLVRWLSRQIERKHDLKDGRRVRRAVNDLIKNGFLISHKGGNTISLNPRITKEIVDYIEKYIRF